MVQISVQRYGLICYAACVNDLGEITVARGLTCEHARRRLLRRIA